ncbi:MAG: hypothetical protein HKN14_11985 [Marinicaulis sp.]|nr:hypothetical protein [Marinicaulis sp.]NNL90213.1 hypothetical protein [Marinicaulis sp.]
MQKNQRQTEQITFDNGGVRPFKAFVSGVRLAVNVDNTRHFFSLMDAIDGPQHERNFQRYLKTPTGARINSEKFEIKSILENRDRLRSFPDGSLGRRYLEFLELEGLDVSMLYEAELEAASSALKLDPPRRLYNETGTAIHDLLHVLTGYGRDPLGEACLLAFTAEQFALRGVAFAANSIALREQLRQPKTPVFRALKEARSRARQMVWIAEIDWRDWLALPIDTVRSELGLSQRRELFYSNDAIETSNCIADKSAA